MSIPHVSTVTCQGCGAVQPFRAWKSLNVTLQPDEKQKILSGESARFLCKKCGWSVSVVYPFLYHDMQKRLMILLRLNEGESEVEAMPPRTFMKDYRFRIVATQNELIEKILVFDAGLDDRVMELFKLTVQVTAMDANRALAGELRFDAVGKQADGKETIIVLHIHGNGSEILHSPMAGYHQIAASLGAKLSGEADSKWLRVDANFARALIT